MFTPRSGVYTGACFPSCDGVWVSTRNELARHRVDTCGEAASQGMMVSSERSRMVAPITPSRGRVAVHERRLDRSAVQVQLHYVSGVGTTPLRLFQGLTQRHRPRARRSVAVWHRKPCAACRQSLHPAPFFCLLGWGSVCCGGWDLLVFVYSSSYICIRPVASPRNRGDVPALDQPSVARRCSVRAKAPGLCRDALSGCLLSRQYGTTVVPRISVCSQWHVETLGTVSGPPIEGGPDT